MVVNKTNGLPSRDGAEVKRVGWKNQKSSGFRRAIDHQLAQLLELSAMLRIEPKREERFLRVGKFGKNTL